MRHTLPTFSWVNICKRPEVNNGPVHSLTSMNNTLSCSSLDKIQLPMPRPALASTKALKNLRSSIFQDFQKPNQLENNNRLILVTPGVIRSMKLKIKKMEVSVCEITNTNINKINSHQFLLTFLKGINDEQSLHNNQSSYSA